MRARLQSHEKKKPRKPCVPNLLIGDSTPESLAWRLADEWPSGGAMLSEAGALLGAHGMNPDSIMRTFALYNVLWDGGEHRVGRRTSESFVVQGARLTMALQVQEPTLRAFIEKNGDLARGTGWFARFLFAHPASTQGFRLFKEAPEHWPALGAFHARVKTILEMSPPINDDGSLQPLVLDLASDAKTAWVTFHDAIEEELGQAGELRDVRDVASKVADNAARLAALFHVFENGPQGQIEVDAINRACRIVAWHLHEGRRFFGELMLSPELSDAVRLDAWLTERCRRHGVTSIAKNDVLQLGPNALRTKVRRDAALDVLKDLGRVRVSEDGNKPIIHVNPLLIEETS